MTITVTFSPNESNAFSCTAYLNISCTEERIPLKLTGEGIGPKAFISSSEINWGDIFVN